MNDSEIVSRVMDEMSRMSMQDIMDDLHLLQAHEIAKILKIGTSTAYGLAARGDLPSLKVGGALRFRPRAVWAFNRAKELVAMPKEEVAAA